MRCGLLGFVNTFLEYFLIDKGRVVTVGELNLAAKQLLENGLPLMWVAGEISNFVRAASGHWYFSLKDEQAQVRCVMFRHKSRYLDWQPGNGMQVEVLALATLYEARGDFQLTLEQMRPAGLGALYERFERLKQTLEREGLFEPARKRALPAFPQRVGVITSPQAAALRDVLTTLARRMPGVPVVLYPTPVQGEAAARQIARAIELANERAECDVLLLCRGGGSIEDLWSFNEEVVARAIAAGSIPLVSGVGHETDFTIADFAADQRAATPTAAAQLVVPDRRELAQHLLRLQQRLQHDADRRLERAMQQLDFIQRRLVHPGLRAQQQVHHLEHLQQRLQQSWRHIAQQKEWRLSSAQQHLVASAPEVQRREMRLADFARRLDEGMQRFLQRTDGKLAGLQQHLAHLDPRQVLARGYSVVRDENGKIVADAAPLSLGARLDITFARGWARTELKDKG